MQHTEIRSNRWKLGWLAASVVLSFLFASTSWALDLDREIQRRDSDSAQILNTLGRGARADIKTSRSTRKLVQLQLIPAHKGKFKRKKRI